MRTAAGASMPGVVTSPARWAAPAIPFLAAGVIAFAVATRVAAPSIALSLGIAAGFGTAVWMFCTQRMERPLAIFLLYLGLLDGYLKLKTNSSSITIGRDALLYAIVLGFLARAVLQHQSLSLPPLSGWVLAFTAAVVVQMANPNSTGLVHTIGALRPHLEFVPLFFVGYAMLQTRARLRTFFLIMLVIATANGIVGLIQLNLTPTQLAAWGPGYAYRVVGNGTGLSKVSGRTFVSTSGVQRTRPFGLGDDAGVGAAWGMLAIGGAIALMSFGLRARIGLWAIPLCVGPPLAVISGEGRSVLIGGVVALFAYVGLATSKRRLIPTFTALIVGLAAIVGVTALVSSISGSGVFDRYATITPSKLAATTGTARGASFSAIGQLIVHHPLGNGLGTVGPASQFAGASGNNGSNGETEPGFLVSELGIPGLLIYYGFNIALLYLGFTRIRRMEPETRSLVAALLSGIIALLVVGISSTTTATSPYSPYLWLAGGALAYWLTTGLAGATVRPTPSSVEPARAVALVTA